MQSINKESLKYYIKTSRPILTFVVAIIMLAGFVYSHANFSIIFLLELIILTLPYSFFLYGINDIYDYETDLLNERKGGVQGIVSKKKYHKQTKILSIVIAFTLIFISIVTYNLVNILSMIGLIFVSYFYSAPSIRAKERPPFDSIFNAFIYFGFPFLLGISFGEVGNNVYLKVALALLGTVSAHSFSTIADYIPDKQAGVSTFAVRFGKRAASLVLVIGSTIIYISNVFDTWLISFFAVVSLFFGLVIFIYPKEKLAYYFLKILYIAFVIGSGVFVLYKINILY